MSDWNPALYLKFKNERTQPSIDLVSRINLDNPKTIIDIGCGPGNSTEILLNKWPQSQLEGIDNSPAMISKAQADYPQQQWAIQDAAKLDPVQQYDLVFSNATIQWLPNHEQLLLDFLKITKDKGALAIQIPLFYEMPVAGLMDTLFKRKYPDIAFDINTIFTFHSSSFYYDALIKHVSKLDLWETTYMHSMDSYQAIVDMIKSTGMKPYLDQLPNDQEKQAFEADVLAGLKTIHPQQANGKVLFPFKRLFFVAYK